MNDDMEMGFEVELSDDEIRTLYYAVTSALDNWPGSPARPSDEQVKLFGLRDHLFRLLLEMSV